METTFFVVRTWNGQPAYSLEHGDFSMRYTKEDRKRIEHRAELPEGTKPDLAALILSYKAGVRLKPKPKPKTVTAVTRNPYKERLLAKLRSEAAQRATPDWAEG
jgi:hypothetical protein